MIVRDLPRYYLTKKLKEPFVEYTDSLFCNKAIIGGWDRTDEPVHPYTTSETMNAGWSWQIEHEERINRGYVFADDFISDEEAEKEFRDKNPNITETGLVRFKAGRYENAWVKNVVAIGNSAGFVEPLEATAIAAICSTSKALSETLSEVGKQITPSIRKAFNQFNARNWDTIADFLAVHYKFNTLQNTEFWQACRNDVDLRGAQPIVDYYQENGPSHLWRIALEEPVCRFRLDGYFTLLVGQKVPHAKMDTATTRERNAWQKLKAATHEYGKQGVSVPDMLNIVKSPEWEWQAKHFAA